MKVAIVYTGRRGGGNLYTLYMAKAAQVNASIKLFLSDRMANLEDFRNEGLPFEAYPTFGSGFIDLFLFPFRLVKFYSAIKRYDPDVIFCTMMNPYVTFLELLSRIFLRKKKIIFTLHNFTVCKHPIDYLIDAFQSFSIRLAPHILVLSQHFKSVVKTKYPEKKVFVIPHPTFSFFKKKKSELGEDFGKYLLFTGRLSEKYKGFETMKKAFEIVKQKNPNLKLVLAGRDADKLPSDDKRIIKMGKWLSDEEYASLIANSFLVAVPYLQPTPSGVVSSATAWGILVVASDLPGLNEQVDENNGMLFPAGDYKKLAQIILSLASDEVRYAKLCQSTKDSAKKLDWKSISHDVELMFKEVLKN
jgi:glycosyltransferase involved in cell wall biosynthesis